MHGRTRPSEQMRLRRGRKPKGNSDLISIFEPLMPGAARRGTRMAVRLKTVESLSGSNDPHGLTVSPILLSLAHE